MNRPQTKWSPSPPSSSHTGHVWWVLLCMIGLALTGCDSRKRAASGEPSDRASATPPAQGELIQPPPPSPAAQPSQPLAAVAAATTATPASQPATNTAQAVPAQATSADGFANIGFDKLSAFSFDVSDDILQADSTNAVAVAKKTADQIPKTVRDFDQKRIALKGFMLPLKVEAGK